MILGDWHLLKVAAVGRFAVIFAGGGLGCWLCQACWMRRISRVL
jgi:hypothetical protein